MVIKDLGRKLGSAVSTAADKTKELAEAAKLKAEITSEKRAVNQAYLEIGKIFYELEKNNPSSPAREYCNRVMDGEETISELKARVSLAKGTYETSDCEDAYEDAIDGDFAVIDM